MGFSPAGVRWQRLGAPRRAGGRARAPAGAPSRVRPHHRIKRTQLPAPDGPHPRKGPKTRRCVGYHPQLGPPRSYRLKALSPAWRGEAHCVQKSRSQRAEGARGCAGPHGCAARSFWRARRSVQVRGGLNGLILKCTGMHSGVLPGASGAARAARLQTRLLPRSPPRWAPQHSFRVVVGRSSIQAFQKRLTNTHTDTHRSTHHARPPWINARRIAPSALTADLGRCWRSLAASAQQVKLRTAAAAAAAAVSTRLQQPC